MATTCKKCFAPLSSTERICHSCGAPVDMTQAKPWGNGDDPLSKNPFATRTRRPTRPSVVAAPSVTMPNFSNTPEPAPEPKVETPAETPVVPEAPVDEPILPMPGQTPEPENIETPSIDIPEAPKPDMENEDASVLPLPPTGGDTVSPTKNMSVSLDSMPQTKPDKKIKPRKIKEPKNPNKKDNVPIYMLIFTSLISIGLAGALIYVLATNNEKVETNCEPITTVVVEPFIARVGKFDVKVPEGFFYTSNGGEAVFYDESQTWSVYATSVEKSMAEIQMEIAQIQENFRVAGYEPKEPETKTIGEREFTFFEVVNGDSAMIVAYTAANNENSFALSIVTASRVADPTILDLVPGLFSNVDFASSSPVNADENGINRRFVSDFTPYVPEPEQPEQPAEEENPEAQNPVQVVEPVAADPQAL